MTRRTILIWLTICAPLLALDLIQKTGTNAPTSLLPGQFGYDLTNQTLYIGGPSSNPVLIGIVGAASTSYVTSAVADRQTTNTALSGFAVDATGTNLLWIAYGVTNTVNITPP